MKLSNTLQKGGRGLFKRKHRRVYRGISAGTILMLLITAGVLFGFAALWPSFTGSQDILFDAAKLAVAMDNSLSQLTASTSQILQSRSEPGATIRPLFLSATAQPAALSSNLPATPAPTPTPLPKQRFSLAAAGSIEWNADARKAMTLEGFYRFDLWADQMQNAMAADVSIATLQNTVVGSEKLNNVNMPSELLAAIRSMGINALCAGQSNALNFGLDGLEETKQAIRKAQMNPFGAYTSLAERTSAVRISKNGVDIALLHYQDSISSAGRKQTSSEERSFALPALEISVMVKDLTQIRANGAQVAIVSLNWGNDQSDSPTDDQRELAQQLADAGADIIIGTGNGALQPVQVLSANRGDGKYHPVLCAYSLGNLFSPDRESRITLSSILLQTDVVYDPATGCIAFENLCYTPTYAWRGKDQGATLQRVLLNNGHLPSFVDEKQQDVAQRCYQLVLDVMADTGVPLAP